MSCDDVAKSTWRWRVDKEIEQDCVHVGIEEYSLEKLKQSQRTGEPMFPGLCIMSDGGCPPWRVYSPNWLERLLGITLKSKVARAVAKAERMCQKHNAEIERFAAEAAGV